MIIDRNVIKILQSFHFCKKLKLILFNAKKKQTLKFPIFIIDHPTHSTDEKKRLLTNISNVLKKDKRAFLQFVGEIWQNLYLKQWNEHVIIPIWKKIFYYFLVLWYFISHPSFIYLFVHYQPILFLTFIKNKNADRKNQNQNMNFSNRCDNIALKFFQLNSRIHRIYFLLL